MGWIFNVEQERNLVHTSASGGNGMYRFVLDLKADTEILIVYAYVPVKAPEGKRQQIAEYITRANYGIIIGGFEFDYSDGEIRYKASIEYAGGELVTSMIENLVGKVAYTINRYFPGIMRVIYGDIDPGVAIHEIEPSRGYPTPPVAMAEVVQALTDAIAAHSEQNPE